VTGLIGKKRRGRTIRFDHTQLDKKREKRKKAKGGEIWVPFACFHSFDFSLLRKRKKKDLLSFFQGRGDPGKKDGEEKKAGSGTISQLRARLGEKGKTTTDLSHPRHERKKGEKREETHRARLLQR